MSDATATDVVPTQSHAPVTECQSYINAVDGGEKNRLTKNSSLSPTGPSVRWFVSPLRKPVVRLMDG